jgi:hypothetical protein
MRALHALAGLAAVAAGATALEATSANAGCSVLSRHPCLPTVCSVFHRGPCIPAVEYWIGQDLRLTIESVPAGEQRTGTSTAHDEGDHPDAGDRELDTLRAMFAALRACWIPPDKDEARSGTQMSVRFAFKRSGEIIATPRVTYATPGIPAETREAYLHAIMAALERCTPLHFSAGLGGAVAGRPIAIRFVDNRDLP